MLKTKMYRKIMSMLLVLFIVTPTSWIVSAANVTLGFETIDDGYIKSGTSTISLTTEAQYVHGGTSALKIEQGGAYAGIRISTPIEKGKTYDYEFYTRFDTNSPGNAFIGFATTATGAPNRNLNLVTLSNQAAYTKISGRLSFYETASTGQLLIYAFPNGSTNQIFYVDDFKLTEVADAPAITSTTPQTYSTGVSPTDLEVMVNFDRAMDTTTLIRENVAVTIGNTTISAAYSRVTFDTLNPTYARISIGEANGAKYTLGSAITLQFSNFKSAAGVAMGKSFINFTITSQNPAKNVNQLTNPGFESPYPLFLRYRSSPATSLNTSYVTQNQRSGNGALKVSTSAAWNFAAMNAFYKPGGKYYYSAWLRLDPASTNPTVPATLSLNLQYNTNTTPVNNLKSNGTFDINTPYKQISGIFDVPAVVDQMNSMVLSFLTQTAGGYTFLVDDVELREIDTLSLASSVPSNNATGVLSTTRTITLDFNNDIDYSTLAGNIKLNNSTSLIQSTAVNPVNNKQVIVTLSSDLSLATTYTISITGIKDIYKQSLATATTSFVTEGAIIDPTVVRVYPANNATNVPLNSLLTVEFDKDMDLSSLISGNIKVNGETTLINTIQKSETNKKAVTIKFNQLTPLTTYTVTMNNVKSLDTGSLASQSFAFTTEGADSLTNLFENSSFENILDTTSMGSYGSTATYDSVYKKTGSYSMKAYQNATYGSLQLAGPTMQEGKTYSYSFWGRVDPSRPGGATNQQMILSVRHTNANPASGKTQEIVQMKAISATSDFVKVSGNYTVPAGVGSSKFSIYSDDNSSHALSTLYVDDLNIAELPAIPAVLSSVPANNSSDTSGNIHQIIVNFTQSVDPLTLIPASIKINGSSSLISSVVPGDDNLSCTINLISDLPENTYVVTFPGVKDIYGQTFADPPITFDTKNYFVKFYKNYGEANVSEITNGNLTAGSLTGLVSYTNKSGSQIDGILVFATYSNNMLIGCQCVNVSIHQNAVNQPYTVTLDVPDDANIINAKLIMVDNNIRPLIKNGELLK